MDLKQIYTIFQNKFVQIFRARRFSKIDLFLILLFVPIFLVLFYEYTDSPLSLFIIIYIYMFYERVDFIVSQSTKVVSSAISAIFFGIISLIGVAVFILWLFMLFKIPACWSFTALIFVYPVFSASIRTLKSSYEFLRDLK